MDEEERSARGIHSELRQRTFNIAPMTKIRRLSAGSPVWLVLLFAFYGPSLNVVGELRYVEVAVLALLLLNARVAMRFIGTWERRLIALFLLAASSQIVSDVINDAQVSGTWKRAGTYVTLALLVVAIRWLSQGDPLRLLFIVAGYCASWVFIMFVGMSSSAAYVQNPWRLGLGFAVTMFICVLLAAFRSLQRYGGVALIVLGGVHLVLLARSLAIVTALTGVLVLIGQLRQSRAPMSFRPGMLLLAGAGVVVVVMAVNAGVTYAVQQELLPDELQAKMELQARNPYGILAAGRPDTIAALYAVSKRPLLGYGSTNVDPDVYAYYVELASATYFAQSNYDALFYASLRREWTLGTPSHSHLLGAWADAGVLASFCWFAVLFMAIKVAVRMSLWSHRMKPLILLTALATMWDVLFSPGPHRMDISLRLTILIFGLELLRVVDGKALRQGCSVLKKDAGFQARS
jgi:hypothetical protein